MAARKKVTPTMPTADTVSIHDAARKYMTTEQSLRLALSHVRPDDFDTVKAVSEADLEAIASHFQPELPTVASTSEFPKNSQNFTQLEQSESSQNLTQQASEPATEQPQNALSLQGQQQHLEQWEFNFKTQVETEANKRFQLAKSQELEKIYHEHDSITSEAMQLFRRLQTWGEKVAHGHQSKAEIIKSMACSYNENLDEVGEAIAVCFQSQ